MTNDEHDWALVAAERNDLADLADTFTPWQWDTPSLSEGGACATFSRTS